MKRQHLPLYVLAAAILITAAVAFGVPVSSLFIVGFVLVCPLMMLFMMRGMQGGGGFGRPDEPVHSTKDHDRDSRLGRP